MPEAGDSVRLIDAVGDLPAGTEGTLLGWYRADAVEALVSLGGGHVTRLPAAVLEKVDDEDEQASIPVALFAARLTVGVAKARDRI